MSPTQGGVPSPLGAWSISCQGLQLALLHRGARPSPVPRLTKLEGGELPQGQQPLPGLEGWASLTRPFPPILPSSLSVGAFVKTWLPFVLLLGVILAASLVFNL